MKNIICKLLKNTVGAIKFLIAFMLAKTLFNKLYKENIWLICEKKNEARDNGYHLFKYIREKQQITNAYYVIDKKSPDLNKIENLGNIIYYDTLKHYIYFLVAEKCISSQTIPYPCSKKLSDFFIILRNSKQKTVWLQHGITKDLLDHKNMDYSIFKYSLLSCAAKRECDFIKEVYGYPENVAKVIGFCRYDKLFKVKEFERIILVMPTHRLWLACEDKNEYANEKQSNNFIKSEFFNEYIKFLNSKQLKFLLEKYNYSLIFYPHYALQMYTRLFNKYCTNDRVIIADRKNYDVQDLLIRSKVLITDYSSVFFDFAYMKKPEIFFQFDEEKYRNSHYKEGYFNYERDGFGRVVYNTDELIKELEYTLNNGEIEKLYNDRIDNFFSIRDDKNCERTYKAIFNISSD